MNTFNTMRPGSSLNALRAHDFNNVGDVTQGAMDAGAGASAGLFTGYDTRPTGGAIYAYNGSGSAIAEFTLCGISDSVVDLSKDLDEVDVSTFAPEIDDIDADAAAAGRVAVTAWPIPAGEVGLVWVAGQCMATVIVLDTEHTGVVIDATTGSYVSSPLGENGVLLLKPTSTGTQVLPVLIRDLTAVGRWGKASAKWVDDGTDTGNGCYVDVNPCADEDGTDTDTSVTVRVKLPRNGILEDPNVQTNTVIPFIALPPDHGGGSGAVAQYGVCVGTYLDGKIDVTHRLIDVSTPIPTGWTKVTDADKKTIAFNEDPPVNGFDSHGDGTNDHEDHPLPVVEVDPTNVNEGDKSVITVGRHGSALVSWPIGQSVDGTHTTSSNWPPYYTLILIRRSS